MRITFVILAAFLFSGCMHLIMTDNYDGSSTQVQPAYEKEVVVGSIKASAVFPPMRIGEETAIIVRLSDTGTNSPIKNATVVAEFSPLHNVNEDSTIHKQKAAYEVIAEKQQAGEYIVRFTPAHAKQYTINIRVTAIANQLFESPLAITTTREVIPETNGHSDGGIHSSGKITMLIAGGAIMATMMIVMLIFRGGIF